MSGSSSRFVKSPIPSRQQLLTPLKITMSLGSNEAFKLKNSSQFKDSFSEDKVYHFILPVSISVMQETQFSIPSDL
jgi:hypothetical protein